jgi:ferredoxin
VPRHRRESRTRTLRVNPVACDGIGICQHVAPNLVRADSWGYPIVSGQALHGADKRAAEAAVASCPRQALFVVEQIVPPPH